MRKLCKHSVFEMLALLKCVIKFHSILYSRKLEVKKGGFRKFIHILKQLSLYSSLKNTRTVNPFAIAR